MKEKIKLIQRKLGVDDDGDFGNETLDAIMKALNITVEVKEPSDLIDTLIKIATKEIGTKEVGNNRGKRVELYQSADWLDGGGYAWCASFICWLFLEAEKIKALPFKRPMTAGAFDFENWAKKEKLKLTMNPKKVKRGDIVIFEFSHIALAVSDSDSTGLFQTVEGNTNPAGSREGDGVYKKTRNVSSLRSSIALP